MNALVTFFAFIGFLFVSVIILSLIIWIMVHVDDTKRGDTRSKKPERYEVRKPKAPVLGTQIRPSGSEPDYSQNIRDWWPK